MNHRKEFSNLSQKQQRRRLKQLVASDREKITHFIRLHQAKIIQKPLFDGSSTKRSTYSNSQNHNMSADTL